MHLVTRKENDFLKKGIPLEFFFKPTYYAKTEKAAPRAQPLLQITKSFSLVPNFRIFSPGLPDSIELITRTI